MGVPLLILSPVLWCHRLHVPWRSVCVRMCLQSPAVTGSSLEGSRMTISAGSVRLPSPELFMSLLSKKREEGKKKSLRYICVTRS